MTKLTARAVRVYAVLEAYRPGQGDVLEAIVPFFEPLLADTTGAMFDPAVFSSAVRDAYGWNVTQDVAEELIPRFLQRGWLRAVGSKGAQAYRNTYAGNGSAPLDATEMKIAQAISEIAEQFEEFIGVISPLSAVSKTRDELAELLIEWLISIDGYTQDAVKSQAAKVISLSGKLSAHVEIPDSDSLTSEDRYLAARFVRHLFETKSNFVGQLSRIASIALLTDVVQDFAKPNSAVTKTDLTVYLDAPVALDYLGVSGKAAKDNAEGLLAPLKKIGGSLRIFRCSVEELCRALHAVLARDAGSRTGPTADAMRRREVLEAYVRAVKEDPASFLKHLGVSVDERTVDQFPNSFQHFTHDQYDALYARINWHLENKPREHDALVTALIMRMRQGQASKDLFRTKVVLVTRNAALVDMTRRFCVDERILAPRTVGPAVHQRQLATASWLRTGLGQDIELPKRYLLAACERVLSVNKGVIEQARASAKNLSAEQARQLELLLTQDRSTQLLMDRTLGVSTVITSDNIESLVSEMKRQLISESAEEQRRAVETEKKRAIEIRKKGEAELEAAKQRETALLRRVEGFDQGKKRVVERAIEDANKSVRMKRSVVSFGIVIFILSLGCLPLLTESVDGKYKLVALAFAGVVASVFGYYQVWDRPLGVRHWLDRWALKKMDEVLEARGLDERSDQLGIELLDGKLVWTARTQVIIAGGVLF